MAQLTDDSSITESAADATALARNLAQAGALWSEAIGKIAAHGMKDDHPLHADPFETGSNFENLSKAFMEDPQAASQTMLEYWSGQSEIWQHYLARFAGADTQIDAPKNKRFAHAAWQENPLLEFFQRSYAHGAQIFQKGITQFSSQLDGTEQRRADFFGRMVMDAVNPANFAAINPEVSEVTLQENGENLVRGMQMLLEDVERGDGTLMIRQTDLEAFSLGDNIANTPGKVVLRTPIFELLQYAPTTKKVYERPVLFVPPWINKYYILDLTPEKSQIKWLLDQGYTVFTISWINPTEAQKDESWASYLQNGVVRAIDAVLEETGADKLNLVGFCIGGTMSATALSWMAQKGMDKVASMTFLATQLDFTDAGDLQLYVAPKSLQMIKEHMDKGYLPAQFMAQSFNMLRPSDLVWNYAVSNYMLGRKPRPFDLLYWNSDPTRMAGGVHYLYLEKFYYENAFAAGELVLDGVNVQIEDINIPIYHLATIDDHIAPPESVYRGAKMMKAPVRFVRGGSGHITGVMNPPAKNKYGYRTNEDMSADGFEGWTEGTSAHEGSWWLDWQPWLAEQSGKMVAARQPGKKLGALDEAPGLYVRARYDDPVQTQDAQEQERA